MGAWSETIMGNDTVLDAEAEIERICGIYNLNIELDTGDIDDRIKQLTEIALRTDNRIEGFLHALGGIILELGCILPDELKNEIIKVTQEEIDEGCTSWCYPEKRIFFLQDFIKSLKEYDGKPTELASESHFYVVSSKNKNAYWVDRIEASKEDAEGLYNLGHEMAEKIKELEDWKDGAKDFMR